MASFFRLIPGTQRPPLSTPWRAFLGNDGWDDYGYKTKYWLTVMVGEEPRKVGTVKIGQFGMGPGKRRPEIPIEFDFLDDSFFSLGQGEDYYESLNSLGPMLRTEVLRRLRDLALSKELFAMAFQEEVCTKSLMRDISPKTVTGQFSRLAIGGARLSQFEFRFLTDSDPTSDLDPPELQFHISPNSDPPTNVHVLIGSNGVGKTYLLNQMAQSLLAEQVDQKAGWRFEGINEEADSTGLFASVISVSFSAFEEFDPHSVTRSSSEKALYRYVGLRRASSNDAESKDAPKSVQELAKDFARSFRVCMSEARRERLRRALESLRSDPVFAQAHLESLLESDESGEGLAHLAVEAFRKLSAGHKIVLLTITQLVELVEERTLVLLDEPEAHLHPPLIAAFVRALSDLLVNRNGVAIVATHSPVVLQEVPRRCVWKIRRIGTVSRFERPDVETFGENVGTLTREAFRLEVMHSGFHKMLDQAVSEGLTFSQVLDRFHGELGAEARAIVRALIATRNAEVSSQ